MPAYLVRMIDTRDLLTVVDEVTDADACEYIELPDGGIMWGIQAEMSGLLQSMLRRRPTKLEGYRARARWPPYSTAAAARSRRPITVMSVAWR